MRTQPSTNPTMPPAIEPAMKPAPASVNVIFRSDPRVPDWYQAMRAETTRLGLLTQKSACKAAEAHSQAARNSTTSRN